ncbi:ABC transporter ATP-binding protein [Natronosporangium hydrolyticum]|uniref:ABC transporter ATP-binding protein n=1 Tax=Natronosporangium hydrolyticum TaxID=2811111 RepID=A0A895YP28_9ACTN|nr:ABC transporter ATP-binding protein [Natronosporangium hydrolyticum]QSB15708.1 ABC transporter ATP-binding protein [Natronosporangium hydrolyticum]
MSDAQIVVSGLTKVYRTVRAVDDLSFAIEPGRVTGFLGPNGAGKTTTLRMLLNLVTPTAGEATIGGRRYADLEQPLRHVGAVLEASSAHRGRTGRNHLRVICAAAGLPPQRVDEVLSLVGLTPAGKRKFKGYSMGMKQRLGIAAAMLGDPDVLILDEPANGLDPEGIRWMRDLLKKLASEGRTVLVSSHLLSEMQLLADDVVIIAAGKLVTQGTMGAVVDGLADAARIRVKTPNPEQLTSALADATVATADGDELILTGVTAPEVGAAALRAGVELHELVTDKPDLERVFLELTAGKAGIR